MRILLSIVFLFLVYSMSAVQQSNMEKMAVSISKFTLFPDSSFHKFSNIAIAEGETFELLDETKLYHEDDSQTQKFKWYKIRLKSGNVGWAFGNNIAVFDQVNTEKLGIQAKKVKLSFNYRNSDAWAANSTGFDVVTSSKTPFIEKYLVFTNAFKNSKFVQIGREQVEGKSWAEDVQFVDLNDDSYHEVVLQLDSKGSMSQTTNQYLEIFTMKHEAMRNIFSEKINLGRSSQNIAPINRKFLEIEDGSIRVAFIDYFDCSDSYGGTCMEYVTYSYVWDKRANKFETLYEPSRTQPVLKPKSDNLDIFPAPGLNQTIGKVDTRETLKVIAQEEKYLKRGDTSIRRIYFLVETFDGKRGYIESKNVEFVENDYSKSLNMYYNEPAVNVSRYGAEVIAVQYNVSE